MLEVLNEKIIFYYTWEKDYLKYKEIFDSKQEATSIGHLLNITEYNLIYLEIRGQTRLSLFSQLLIEALYKKLYNDALRSKEQRFLDQRVHLKLKNFFFTFYYLCSAIFCLPKKANKRSTARGNYAAQKRHNF